jgi:hypothetical protein
MKNHHHLPASFPGRACATFAPLLLLGSSGALAPEQARQLQTHLAGCAYCQSRRAAYARMEAALRRHFERKGSEPLRTDEILRRIRQEEGLEDEEEDEPPLERPRCLKGKRRQC